MKLAIELPDGKYVVAVSGGVDSMVLLDLALNELGSERILVAHFQHNVRSSLEQSEDEAVIGGYCRTHNLTMKLGTYTGGARDEASLREARYEFLEEVRSKLDYNAVITGHHNDDLLETAIFNILRGTSGAGLNSMRDQGQLLRPLLRFTKEEILEYAHHNKIPWHQDVTNEDERYTRNYIRRNIIPAFDEKARTQLLGHIDDAKKLKEELEESAQSLGLAQSPEGLHRHSFIMLPHKVSKFAMHRYLKASTALELTNALIERTVIFAKTAPSNTSIDLGQNYLLRVENEHVAVIIKH